MAKPEPLSQPVRVPLDDIDRQADREGWARRKAFVSAYGRKKGSEPKFGTIKKS